MTGQRQNLIDAFAEAKSIGTSIDANEEEASSIPDWVVANLERFDSFSDLNCGFRVSFLQQVRQYQMLILQNTNKARDYHSCFRYALLLMDSSPSISNLV